LAPATMRQEGTMVVGMATGLTNQALEVVHLEQ